MSELTFNEELHEYRLDGRVLPSVTQVLWSMGHIDTAWFTEESRIRGTLVHKLCELHDLGTLDVESIDPKLAGYLEAWKTFCRMTEIVWTSIEKKAHHPGGSYAGTPDRRGITSKGKKILVDIKSGPFAQWHRWQIGGYLDMELADEALSVHLSPEGVFMVQYYDVTECLYNWRDTYYNYTTILEREKNGH